MCGIVGVFANNDTIERQWLFDLAQNMLSRISHRGFASLSKTLPFKSFSIGSVRLPIVDEFSGDQPMLSESKRIILVFNGEIYNHESLRMRFLSGKIFKTKSDSEVIANLLEEYGVVKTLSLLEGMFAFIAYDFIDKRYFVARDKMGIKPLYIAEDNAYVLAASEIKAFDQTFNNVYELLPQHYYDSKSGIKKWKFSTPKTENGLRELISKSVKEQVNTSLPLAIFLSGGIDSSIICYEANQFHPNVTAFAIGKKESNDIVNAKKVCEHFNFRFEPIVINDKELLDSIEETIFTIESFEPNLIRAGTLSYLLSRHVASRGFRVALLGCVFENKMALRLTKDSQIYKKLADVGVDRICDTQAVVRYFVEKFGNNPEQLLEAL